MATETIIIQGENFSVPQPFAEGHVCSAADASTLNQTYAENVRNNFAKKVKEAKEAGSFDPSAMQSALDDYTSKYTFGVRVGGGGGGGGRKADPVQAEAVKLATDRLKDQLRRKGKNVSDYSGKQLREAALKVIERDPSIMEQAREIVALRKDVAEESLDDLVSALTPDAVAAPSTASDAQG